ncbi:PEP-CTERM sorting domain-containing protein [Colwellia sp. 20A7]|uniref:PEP-CTERM sorting domain-containing protein n=1 Tax=Colwellia sp. 20A7 TaxID=2689569 RepID=UPI00135BE53C|nr:PEP-CTERM sorting domain-containing protein [Colwellia sp. 20A7]
MKKTFIGAVFLLASSSAFAGLITETGTFGTQGSSTDVPLGTLSETISINAFDTQLGTLTGVDITVFGQIDTVGTSTNTATANGRADVAMHIQNPWQVTTLAADGYVFQASAFNYLTDQSSASGFDMASGDTFNFSLTSGELSSALTGVNLAAFTTGLAVDFNFSGLPITALSNVLESGTGDFVNNVATASWGKVVVNYTYSDSPATSVSEPGTLAILALGLVGFAASRKKKASL